MCSQETGGHFVGFFRENLFLVEIISFCKKKNVVQC